MNAHFLTLLPFIGKMMQKLDGTNFILESVDEINKSIESLALSTNIATKLVHGQEAKTGCG